MVEVFRVARAMAVTALSWPTLGYFTSHDEGVQFLWGDVLADGVEVDSATLDQDVLVQAVNTSCA